MLVSLKKLDLALVIFCTAKLARVWLMVVRRGLWVVGSVYKSRVVGVAIDVGVDVAVISMFDIYLIIRYLATRSITGNITF